MNAFGAHVRTKGQNGHSSKISSLQLKVSRAFRFVSLAARAGPQNLKQRGSHKVLAFAKNVGEYGVPVGLSAPQTRLD
jgi:hypothetical protein